MVPTILVIDCVGIVIATMMPVHLKKRMMTVILLDFSYLSSMLRFAFFGAWRAPTSYLA